MVEIIGFKTLNFAYLLAPLFQIMFGKMPFTLAFAMLMVLKYCIDDGDEDEERRMVMIMVVTMIVMVMLMMMTTATMMMKSDVSYVTNRLE